MLLLEALLCRAQTRAQMQGGAVAVDQAVKDMVIKAVDSRRQAPKEQGRRNQRATPASLSYVQFVVWT